MLGDGVRTSEFDSTTEHHCLLYAAYLAEFLQITFPYYVRLNCPIYESDQSNDQPYYRCLLIISRIRNSTYRLFRFENTYP